MSWASSASVCAKSRFTGAEKPRRIEATGDCVMPSKTKLWLDCVSESTRVGKASLPSGSTRPTATGICSGPVSATMPASARRAS